VKNTLLHGYELYRGLKHPFAKALAMKFIVSEVHPFNDGNGRISRAMMNAELVSAGIIRIIIPSVYRYEYLSGLRRLSNANDPGVFIKQMKHAHNFVSKVDFSNRDKAISILRECNAFAKPSDDVLLQMPIDRVA
jgi:fido (protein-threonine AMPylation protein)